MASTHPEPAELHERWQHLLRDAVRDVDELARLLELPAEGLRARAGAHYGFPLLVPRSFVTRMRPRDPDDPLLLQVLPRPAEAMDVPGFSDDPLEESRIVEHGLIHKYRGRALLVTTGACPVHCRYCFRRAFPYVDQSAVGGALERALAAIEEDESIEEVVLSGGDPLSLSNARLGRLLGSLERIGHVRTVRIHTRFPVVLPERVDEALLALLEDTSLAVVAVVHVNHANELDAGVADALAELRRRVRFLLNQSVLLHGVNDDAGRLAALSTRLFECGVVPYYLHMLDRVRGAAHFEVDAAAARDIVASLRRRLPGYLVPRLVKDVPGALSKTPMVLGPD